MNNNPYNPRGEAPSPYLQRNYSPKYVDDIYRPNYNPPARTAPNLTPPGRQDTYIDQFNPPSKRNWVQPSDINPSVIEGEILSKKVRNRTVRQLMKDLARFGLRKLPLLRYGMNIMQLLQVLGFVARYLRNNTANTTMYGYALKSDCSSLRGPATPPYRSIGFNTNCLGSYASLYWSISTTPGTNPYLRVASRHLTQPGQGQVWKEWGPIPASDRAIPLTRSRQGLLPNENFDLAELPEAIRRAVAEELAPYVASSPFTDPMRVPQVTEGRGPAPELQQVVDVSPGRLPDVATRPNPGFPISRPPARGVREKKFRTTPMLGAIIFKVLDEVSESAEKIDCVFSSLPEKTQKKYKSRNKKKRGLVDTAGQYGIDGADWKIPAIYDNLDQVDWARAIKCAALNEVEDKIIGSVNAVVRKAYRGPTTPLGGAFGKKVSEWLDVDNFEP